MSDTEECFSNFTVLLGPGVLSTRGEQHRRQRKLLNPVFSVAHLRDMTHIFYNVAYKVICMHSHIVRRLTHYTRSRRR